MKNIIIIFSLVLVALLGSCNSKESTIVEAEDLIIDANQFSNISTIKLIELMGEPQSKEPYEWQIPNSGQGIVGELYIYENNKYEFVVFDDLVTRLNIYSGTFWGYDKTTLDFKSDETILSVFGINDTRSDMRKTKDTGLMQKFERVSDTIYSVELQGINETKFDLAEIIYNDSYY